LAINSQPAKKSYFFSQGYKDLANIIGGAWKRNVISIDKCRERIKSSEDLDGSTLYFLKLIINSYAILSILIFSSAITLMFSTVHILILLFIMSIVYIGYGIVWSIDRTYLTQKRIFTACHVCYHKSLIPIYLCPECDAEHTDLTPGVYGILKRSCNCGAKLPTTFFNGRRKLIAICPNCAKEGIRTYLNDRETVPICIPVVGGRSVGKTAFINAFSKGFIEKIAPAKYWEIEIYNKAMYDVFTEIDNDYQNGSTRMTERYQNVVTPTAKSFSFFVKGKKFSPERLVHIYDIAGEEFTDKKDYEAPIHYGYCHGIVFIVDPFSIKPVMCKYGDQLISADKARIGMADINLISYTLLNKLREVTGFSDEQMLSVPLAVVINKADSAGLFDELGGSAVNSLLVNYPEKFNNEMDAQDHLCRKFFKENGLESFLNTINIKFKNNRFFVCSAIGHTADKGAYQPKGVMEPMEWIFRNADPKMDALWRDTNFSERPPSLNGTNT